MAKQSQQLILMLVIGVLIGTTGVMAWKTRSTEEADSANVTTKSGATTSVDTIEGTPTVVTTGVSTLPRSPEVPKNSRVGISVADQSAGNSVTVSGLDIKETHWVAVYDQQDGAVGSIIGAARVHPGDVVAEVSLLRATVAGATYYAAILSDDGDNTFNRQTDLPPLSPDKVVIVSFLTK
jgi:hypothetical protein